MIRMQHALALAVAATMSTLLAQQPSPSQEKDARPELSLSFEHDGRTVRLHVRGTEVKLADDAGDLKIEQDPRSATTFGGARVIDESGATIARLEVAGGSVRIQFPPERDGAWLGVDLQPVPDALAQHLDLDVEKVALVAKVHEDSPAAQGGLITNDILIGLEGSDAADADAVRARTAAARPGDEVVFTVLRHGEERQVTIELGQRPAAWSGGGTWWTTDGVYPWGTWSSGVGADAWPPQAGSMYQWRVSPIEWSRQHGFGHDDSASRPDTGDESAPRSSIWYSPYSIFGADGQTYVLPSRPKVDLFPGTSPDGAAADAKQRAADPAARLDQLEAKLDRIEQLLEKLGERREH